MITDSGMVHVNQNEVKRFDNYMKYEICMHIFASRIKGRKRKFLQEVTTCSKDKSEKCYLDQMSKHKQPNCSTLCTHATLKGYPKCKTIEDYACNLYPLSDISSMSIKKCPKHCEWVEYHGAKLTSYYNYDDSIWKSGKRRFRFWWSYNFDNDLIEVYEEYLMYDAIGLIGTVGGTLGLFIGFSFLDVSSILMNFFASFINSN